MRELLPRLAPHLPGILRALQGLGNRGLIAQAAELEVGGLEGARGAAAAWADLSTIPREALTRFTLFETAPLGELLAELEASTEGLEGRLRVEVPGGLE
jgi:hypothetical protein